VSHATLISDDIKRGSSREVLAPEDDSKDEDPGRPVSIIRHRRGRQSQRLKD
jgi:hypothetical protein